MRELFGFPLRAGKRFRRSAFLQAAPGSDQVPGIRAPL